MSETFGYGDLARRVADLERLARMPPAGERTALASSYDRASRYEAEQDRYVDWGANADGTGVVRVEEGQEVLAELEGPGCIWRIWSATVGSGHVRIYLDGAAQPAVDLPFSAYFDRTQEPFTRPGLVYQTSALGYNNYTPIPFQSACRIVAAPGWGKYYHFNYTRFAPGTRVPTFHCPLEREDAAALDGLDRHLRQCGTEVAPLPGQTTVAQSLRLAAGTRATVADLVGARQIVALRVRVDLPAEVAAQRRWLRQLVVEMRWDDEPEPAVWAPLGDFFGCAAGAVPFQTLPLGLRDDGTFYCSWRMPFARRALVRVTNDAPDSVQIETEIDHAPLAQSAGYYLRFHAKWHRDVLPVREDRHPDWTLLRTQGRGRFVGTQLHVWNPRGGWWGEGDEKFFVDGERFPSTFGTGTEDYLGYAWSSGNTFVQALHSQPVNENNRGHVSANRWHIPDDIPFQHSFEAVIEKYFPNDNPCHWAAVAFWYLAPGGVDSLRAAPVDERVQPWDSPPIWREAGVIEAEDLPVLKQQWPFAASPLDAVARQLPAGVVSNDRILMWWVDRVGYRLELGGLRVSRAGRYRLWARFVRDAEMGRIQFDLDGVRLGGPVDLFAPTAGRPPLLPEPVELGVVELTAGEHVLGAETVGRHPDATGYLMAVDYFRFEPLT